MPSKFGAPPLSAEEEVLVLREAFDALEDQVALLGSAGELVAVNRAWAEFAAVGGFGPVQPSIGASYLDLCAEDPSHGSETGDSMDGVRRVLAGEVDRFELDRPCRAGAVERWVRMRVRRLTCRGPVAAIVTHTDRTHERLTERAGAVARERAEEERKAADFDRRRLEATLQALPVGVWIADNAGRVTHTNPAAASIWGGAAPRPERVEQYSEYHARWPATGERVTPEQWPLVRTLATGETVAGQLLEITRFDGTVGHTLNSTAPIHDADGNVTGAVVVNVDFTAHEESSRERQRLLAELERERMQLASVFEHAPSFIVLTHGPEHVFTLFNPASRAFIGDRDVVGKPLAEAFPELQSQGFSEVLDRVYATGEPWRARQVIIRIAQSADGPLETHYLDLVYQRLESPTGDYSILTHGIDVTEQVLATERLTQNERRLREQFAKIPVPTYLWKDAGDEFVLLDCNEAAAELLRQHGRGGLGRLTSEIFPGSPLLIDEIRRSLRENTVVRKHIDYELAGGIGRREFDITIGPQQPDRVLLHALDVTDRVELEAQLRQSQKMDAVGQLAGGIAHDFNNLLTVISAHSALMLEALAPADPLREDADAIHRAGGRAAGLTRQLLAFSRKQILKPDVIDLNAPVSEARKMLGRLLGEHIEICTELSDDVKHVVADPSQIDQVLLNLALNARDAMPSGGRLTITTRTARIRADEAGSLGLIPEGEYAVLSVRDAGVGMDAAVQSRVFEPFFTTKAPGKGTGLGLATVYGIVKQSNGHVLVDSALGEGTKFDVYLPAVEASATERAPETASSSAHGETVLLVEDEPAVREVAKRVLRREGYLVLEAQDGASALAASAQFDAEIHLVLSDVVMPGMHGGEVVRRLQEARPGLKALFMSGYTDDEIVRRGIGSSAWPFVQKPFAARDLLRAVREALEG